MKTEKEVYVVYGIGCNNIPHILGVFTDYKKAKEIADNETEYADIKTRNIVMKFLQ